MLILPFFMSSLTTNQFFKEYQCLRIIFYCNFSKDLFRNVFLNKAILYLIFASTRPWLWLLSLLVWSDWHLGWFSSSSARFGSLTHHTLPVVCPVHHGDWSMEAEEGTECTPARWKKRASSLPSQANRCHRAPGKEGAQSLEQRCGLAGSSSGRVPRSHLYGRWDEVKVCFAQPCPWR